MSTSKKLIPAGIIGLIFAVLLKSFGSGYTNAPALNVSLISSNQVQLTVSNGVSGATYEIFTTPALNTPGFPWQTFITNGAVNQTNFTITLTTNSLPQGFYKAQIGNDADFDGVLDWQDARPYDPTIGILTVTIETPTNNSTVY